MGNVNCKRTLELNTAILTFSLVVFFATSSGLVSNARTRQIERLLSTITFAGKYEKGKSLKKPVGLVCNYAATDSTVLFYVDLNRGAPSCSMVSILGRLIIKKKGKVFESLSFQHPFFKP